MSFSLKQIVLQKPQSLELRKAVSWYRLPQSGNVVVQTNILVSCCIALTFEMLPGECDAVASYRFPLRLFLLICACCYLVFLFKEAEYFWKLCFFLLDCFFHISWLKTAFVSVTLYRVNFLFAVTSLASHSTVWLKQSITMTITRCTFFKHKFSD